MSLFDPKSFEHRCVELVVERTDNDGCLDEGMRDLCHADIRKLLEKELRQAWENGAKAMREACHDGVKYSAIQENEAGSIGRAILKEVAKYLIILPLPPLTPKDRP